MFFEEPYGDGSQRSERRKQKCPKNAPARDGSPAVNRRSAIDRSGLAIFPDGPIGERRRSAINYCRRETLLFLQTFQCFFAQAAKAVRILGRPRKTRLGVLFQFLTSIKFGLGCHPKFIPLLARSS